MKFKLLGTFLVAACLAFIIPWDALGNISVASSQGNPRARAANGQWIALTPGAQVPTNATIITGPSDRLVLRVNGSTVNVAPNTNVLASRVSAGGSSIASRGNLASSRAQGNVSTSISSVAGVRAERSDRNAPFSHFRRPANRIEASASSPDAQLDESLEYFNVGDFESARQLAAQISSGSNDVQARAKFVVGLSAYSTFDYLNAISAFEEARELGLDAERAEQALMYIGMSFFNIGDNAASNTSLYAFLEQYPESELRSTIMYQIALNFMEIGDASKVRNALNYIINNFEATDPIVEMATEDLGSL